MNQTQPRGPLIVETFFNLKDPKSPINSTTLLPRITNEPLEGASESQLLRIYLLSKHPSDMFFRKTCYKEFSNIWLVIFT